MLQSLVNNWVLEKLWLLNDLTKYQSNDPSRISLQPQIIEQVSFPIFIVFSN